MCVLGVVSIVSWLEVVFVENRSEEEEVVKEEIYIYIHIILYSIYGTCFIAPRVQVSPN